MARSKGTVFVALKSFIRKRFGDDGWQRFLASMPDADRVQVEMPVSGKWYELALVHRALHALVDELGGGNVDIAEDFGKHDAENDLNTVQRIFLRLANPAYAIEKSGQYWSRFCDFGELKVTRHGKNSASATLTGVPLVEELYCRQLTGYLTRLFELVGAKDLKVSHSECCARGDRQCTWMGTWRE
jgi:predicted hydrocarbon binding protein